MDQKMMEMLQWYANGSLAPDERQFVEQHLDEHPAYRQQLAFFEALRREVQRSVPPTEPDLGLAATLNKINRHSNPRREVSSEVSRAKHWLERLFSGDAHFRPAYALGVAVIATQTAIIGYLASDTGEPYSQTRAKQIVPPSIGPFVKVSFVPDAKETDIRFLMIQLGASIVGGPSQLGDYYLFLKPDRTDWAAQQLRKSPFVDSVSVIATLPAAKE